MCVLDVKNITVSIEGNTLVDDISLKVHTGEIHAIVGPNGAGKTTLLNAIIGDIPLQTGILNVCGQSTDWAGTKKARSVAVLPQLSLLNFPYTVREVVALGRTPHNTGYKLDHEIVCEAMQAMDIVTLADRYYTQLSGGEKQRTQLARVMAQVWRNEDSNMRLLMLDEPTSALDLGHQEQLMEAVQHFAQAGVGVLMVVHDINIAAKYATHMLALYKGRALATGETSAVISEPLLRKLFDANVHIVEHPQTKKMHVI